ncbi:MAG: glycosyltransferase [Pseudomonadota bacterium]
MTNNIRVSMVASTDSTYGVVRRSVELLTDQTRLDAIQLILVGPSRDVMQPDLETLSKFAAYEIIEIGAFQSTGASMAAGYQHAEGDILVYVEEHGFPPVDFAEKLIETFDETGSDVVGYGLLPSNPGNVAWAHIYAQFGGAVPPQPSGYQNRLGPHHVAYRASALPLDDPAIGALLSNEAALHEMMRQQGKRLYYRGDLALRHAQISDFWSLLTHEFLSGVTFADARRAAQNWPIWKRAVYVLGAPLIPFWRTGRAMVDMHRSGRLLKLSPSSPLIILAVSTAGAAGEVVGYTIGTRQWITDWRSTFELDRFAFVNESDQIAAPKTAEEARKLT